MNTLLLPNPHALAATARKLKSVDPGAAAVLTGYVLADDVLRTKVIAHAGLPGEIATATVVHAPEPAGVLTPCDDDDL